MSANSARLLKIDDLCTQLNIGRTTVWRFVKSGRLPQPMTIPGMRGARWTDADIQTFLDETITEYREAS